MALQITGLCKRFGAKEAVVGVDLTLEPGRIVGLLGPSGSGKSTIFDLIAGNLTPNSGRIRLDERELTGLTMEARARTGLGYSAQSMSLFGELTVAKNILMGLQAAGHRPLQAAKKLADICDKFELSELLDQPLYTLSGGQRRIVEFAFSVAGDTRYLLLDEPFVKLDPAAITKLTGLLQNWAKGGRGILISSHRLDIVFDLIDEVYILQDGRILAKGTPDEVLKDRKARIALMGPSGSNSRFP